MATHEMTPAEFKTWRGRLGFSQAAAARELDLNKWTIKRYEREPESVLDEPPFPIPRVVALACRWLEHSLSR
jgi:DNA-binding XRE family transcriptional regulator